jgi:hypothetical protein
MYGSTIKMEREKRISFTVDEANKFEFFRKGFYVCLAYVVWDLFRAWGWL